MHHSVENYIVFFCASADYVCTRTLFVMGCIPKNCKH
nr:MAG TPA: hypothetical protein [Caudoviricetes sp.]